MDMTQTILWTALPKGVNSDGKLLLSILVSPRLDTGGDFDLPLDQFPFYEWPSQEPKIFIQFGTLEECEATRISPAPDIGLWNALFPPEDTVVRSFTPSDLHKRRIHSFPVVHLVNFLKKAYAAIGVASATELPRLNLLEQQNLNSIRTIDGEGNWWESIEKRLETDLLNIALKDSKALPPEKNLGPQMNFFQAKHFFKFRGGDYDKPPTKPDLDFHQALTVLGEHPELLRCLGLLIDVSVSPPEKIPNRSTVQVRRVEPDFSSEFRRVKLHYVLDKGKHRFLAAPRSGSDLKNGMLNLGDPAYSLQQVDVDGTALKAIEFANYLEMRLRERLQTTDSPAEEGLPALRSGGISLVYTGRAARLVKTFEAVDDYNTALNTQQPPELWAEDVMRGFRVDIEDNPGTWRSLCQRQISYKAARYVDEPDLPEVQDEGTVTTTVMEDVDPEQPDLFLHEALFHWDGWSLAAPRPGQVIQDKDSLPEEELGNPSETSLELEITAQALPGSLPRLRFGKSYRLRARTVDLAGQSLPHDSADDACASTPIRYRRFEPVEPPAVFIVSGKELSFLPGESANRLVIRTYNETPADDGTPSPEVSDRALLPPRTAVAMIEQYGLLDKPAGLDGSQDLWDLLALKDEATILKDDLTNLDIPYHDPSEIPIEVPYLTDPFAQSAVLRGLPGTATGTQTVISFFDPASKWWQAKPFRLSVIEGSQPPLWDDVARVLTVQLPKAAVAKVRISCRIPPSDLNKLAIWKWLEDEVIDTDELARLKQSALDGTHWMLTPFRTLTLVHAVQQPLAAPHINTLNPRKEKLGDTFAIIQGEVDVHAPSTGKVDLLARWDEPNGETAADTLRKEGAAHVFELPVHNPEDLRLPWGGRRHEFGDTKYRRVTYYAVGTTRFREYFETQEPKLTPTPLHFSRPPEAELPPDDDRHVFEAEVLNSARPLAPNLLYVVPTFGWESGYDDRGSFSRRTGGLRLYFEKPWFSSGDGELLGVVIWPGAGDNCELGKPVGRSGLLVAKSLKQTVPDRLKPYATQWGRDPIWLSGPTQQVPSLQNFTQAVAVASGLTLEELKNFPAERVSVAGHRVHFDDFRHLFYCDIDIEAGASYFPFVRLALARYQPNSLPEAELSRVVLADFMQFAPDRLAWVSQDPADPTRVQVTVSGTGYRKNASFNCTSVIEARLERWLGDPEGIGWVPVSPDPVTLMNVQALRNLSVWEGVLVLPPHQPGTLFRVIVEEYESFLGDVPGELPEGTFKPETERRLVYSDAIELRPAR
jgi:hypothetical protein